DMDMHAVDVLIGCDPGRQVRELTVATAITDSCGGARDLRRCAEADSEQIALPRRCREAAAKSVQRFDRLVSRGQDGSGELDLPGQPFGTSFSAVRAHRVLYLLQAALRS